MFVWRMVRIHFSRQESDGTLADDGMVVKSGSLRSDTKLLRK